MDAVAEVRSSIEHAIDAWAKDGKTLFQTAKTYGVDTGPATAMLTGQLPAGTLRQPAGRRGRPGGGNGRAGGAASIEKILTALQSGPMNQSQLATRFHTSRQTIAKRLDDLVDAGSVGVRTEGHQKVWFATGTAGGGDSSP